MLLFLSRSVTVLGLVLAALLGGFFYAWICSTMWGLDAADPRISIAAMQAMNASVRNAVFAPAFFATGPVLILAGVLAWAAARKGAAALLGLGGLIILVLASGLTMVVNVPMNEALATVVVPDDIEAARAIWLDYSPRWQVWNIIRTLTTGLGFGLGLWGFARLVR